MQLIEEHPPTDACLVHLVRHGATPHNLMRPPRMQGDRIDESLSDLGVEQAARAAAALAGRPFAAFYTSPLKRAAETAEAIARPHNLPVTRVEGLREVNVGEWEGMTWDEIEAGDNERYHQFRNDPTGCRYPGGESLAELRDRVTDTVGQIARDHIGEEVVAVAHSVVNRCYLAGLLGLPLNGGRRVPQLNTGVSLVLWRPERARVLSLNNVQHLL